MWKACYCACTFVCGCICEYGRMAHALSKRWANFKHRDNRSMESNRRPRQLLASHPAADENRLPVWSYILYTVLYFPLLSGLEAPTASAVSWSMRQRTSNASTRPLICCGARTRADPQLSFATVRTKLSFFSQTHMLVASISLLHARFLISHLFLHPSALTFTSRHVRFKGHRTIQHP